LDPRFVPGNSRQMAAAGPAAISIHDDCDMRGQPRRIYRSRDRIVSVSGRELIQQSLHLSFMVAHAREMFFSIEFP
jgi:plasmid stabilization system protein ParE